MTEKKYFNLLELKVKANEVKEEIDSIRIALTEDEDVRLVYKGKHNIVSLGGWTIFKTTINELSLNIQTIFSDIDAIMIKDGGGNGYRWRPSRYLYL